jgi:ubiquitin carboxyl-terminal hydrolase 1
MTPLVSRGIWDQRGGVLGALQSGQPVAQVPDQKKVIYRLSSVILHYGYTHSSGHYVCIRRKPVPASLPSANGELSASNGQLHTSTPAASTNIHVDTGAANGDTRADVPSTGSKACPDGCRCEDCVYFGQARELDALPGRGWLRISDADVEEVGVEALVEARAQVSMLFYELVREYEGPARQAVAAEVA